MAKSRDETSISSLRCWKHQTAIHNPEIQLRMRTLAWVSTKGLLALASSREIRENQQCWQNSHMQKCHLTAQQHRTAPTPQDSAAELQGLDSHCILPGQIQKCKGLKNEGGSNCWGLGEAQNVIHFLQHQPRNAQSQHPVSDRGH